MTVHHVHALVISALRTVITLVLIGPNAAVMAASLPSPPGVQGLWASPRSIPQKTALDPPTIVEPGQVVHVPTGSSLGTSGVINQGVIWGNGTLNGNVDNQNLLITSETEPGSSSQAFAKPKQNIARIPTVSSERWLQSGRVSATDALHVTGDFRQSNSGSLWFTVTPQGNSRLDVNGSNLALNGTLLLDLENFNEKTKGPLRPTYTLINSTDPAAKLSSDALQILVAHDNSKWNYRITETDTGQVFLTLDPVKYFQKQGQSSNQVFLGQLLDHEVPKASGALYDVLNRLYQLPPSRLQDTLTRIDGELHAETPGILYSTVADAWNPVYARMGMSASQGGYVAGGDPHFWASGLGSFGGVEGNANATGYQQQSAGSLIGADTRILDFLHVGLTAGYLSAAANRNGLDNHLTSTLWQIGTYADMPLGEHGNFGLLIGYDQGGTQTQNASLLGTSNATGEAKLVTAEAIASWHYELGQGHSLTPIISLQSITTQHSRVTESGLPALNSVAGSFSGNFVSARIQARYDYQWRALETDWTSSLAVGFREMLNQPTADREIRYIGTSGGDLLVEGAQPNSQTGAGLINAGLTGHLADQFDLELGYRGIYTGTSRLSSFQGNLVWHYDAPTKTVDGGNARQPAFENPNALDEDKKPLTIRDPGADMANYPNSAFTLPEGGFYLESVPFSFTGKSASSGPQTMNGQVLFRYGLVDDIELRLFYTPWEVQSTRSGVDSGSGPLAFDTKIHLWDAWEEYFIPAAGFELTITTPWLASTAFQSPTSPGFSFNFDQDLPFGIGIEYNLGATNYEDPHDLSQSVWQFAGQWAAQKDITEDVAVFFNGYYNRTTLPRVSHHHTEFREEARYRVICSENGLDIGQTTCQKIEHIVNVPYTVRLPLDPVTQVPVVMGAGLIWTVNDHIQLFGNAAAGINQGSPGLQTYMGFAWTP
ncbi:MAG: hypothetical protein RL333_1014 [Pseudomonadota bacterium]|jgi:outer membrane autotransporter protein